MPMTHSGLPISKHSWRLPKNIWYQIKMEHIGLWNFGRFLRLTEAFSLFLMKAAKHRHLGLLWKTHNGAQEQSTVYTSAIHLRSSRMLIRGQIKRVTRVWFFQRENKNCKTRELSLSLLSRQRSLQKREKEREKKKGFEFFKVTRKSLAAASFNCGWSSKPRGSFDRGKVNSLHGVNAGRCEEGAAAGPTLRGTARVGWKKKKNTACSQ